MAAASSNAGGSSSGGTSKSTKKTASKASGAGTKTKKTTVRKKATTKKTAAKSSKTSATTINHATWNSARTSQMELAHQRKVEAARMSDPLWYRAEDVVATNGVATPMANNFTVLPEQISIVENALSYNGLSRSDITPQAFACLLEQARRYAIEVLADAQDFAHISSRSEISKADLQLSTEMRPDNQVAISLQLPKLGLMAQHINRVPLPPIPTQCYNGVLLPPKQHQLTARTFDVVSGVQVEQKVVQPKMAPPRPTGRKSQPSYGATRGRQIGINFKKGSSSSSKSKSKSKSSSATSGSSQTAKSKSSSKDSTSSSTHTKSAGGASGDSKSSKATPMEGVTSTSSKK